MSAHREPVGSSPSVLIELDRGAGGTLHERLELSLRDLIRTGRLGPGTRVPSSRALAAQLGVSRGVVLESYAQLIAEGYLVSRQGAPTTVAAVPSVERPPLAASSLSAGYPYQFDPSLPDLGSFPMERWLRSLRGALRAAPFRALGYGDPRGTSELRNELMSYLARVRAAAPEPEHTLVCSGFTHGFAVLCRALRDRGLDRIAVEDPGWMGHRLVAERAGLEPVAVPVDGRGIDVDALEQTGCEAVVVTSAHQFPTGVVLSSERRAALLEWAEERDGLIVEDDYDSELRYDRDPVGTLQGLAPERVCHLGSVSKRLVPALRLGWLLSPSWLTGAVTYEEGATGGGTSVVGQLALADLIARGELDRHLRRMRLRYRKRREALIGALAAAVPEASPVGAAAGLFVLVLLPDGITEAAVIRAAAARGVALEGATGGGHGLVLGYANMAEPTIVRGVTLLAEAVEGVKRTSDASI